MPKPVSSSPRFQWPSGLRLMNAALGGWTVLVFAFLYLPIAVLVIYSFNTSRLNIVWEGFTFDWYAKVWQDTLLMRAMNNSLIVATVTTTASAPGHSA